MTNTKRNLLLITDQQSQFDLNIPKQIGLFNQVDVVYANEEGVNAMDTTSYDIVIGDLSVDPEQVGLLKKIKDTRDNIIIFAMVDPKDTEKLYKIADMGINAFELLPEQFEMALEEISRFYPD